MIETIRSILSSLIDSLSTITLDELPQRLTLIREALIDPRANPLPFFMGLSMLLIVLLIIVISIVLGWMLLTRDKTNRLNYALLDTQGEVIERIEVEDAPQSLLSSRQQWARRALRLILATAGIGALLASFGAATRSRTFCASCHQSTNHTISVMEGEHATIGCTDCHETGSVFQAITTNAPRRLVHVIGGLIDADAPVSGYGTVTSASCLQCHDDDVVGVSSGRERSTVRMSHREPLGAGMPCTACHEFNESQELGAPDRGMQVCLKCHNNEQAAATCKTCHAQNPLTYARNAQWEFTSRLLAHVDPRQSCYRCHDPGPCDNCHGIRMPHPDDFTQMDRVGGHGAYSREHGIAVCFNCHNGRSTMGATDCYLCHPTGMF
jgi:hypothetical protein